MNTPTPQSQSISPQERALLIGQAVLKIVGAASPPPDLTHQINDVLVRFDFRRAAGVLQMLGMDGTQDDLIASAQRILQRLVERPEYSVVQETAGRLTGFRVGNQLALCLTPLMSSYIEPTEHDAVAAPTNSPAPA